MLIFYIALGAFVVGGGLIFASKLASTTNNRSQYY